MWPCAGGAFLQARCHARRGWGRRQPGLPPVGGGDECCRMQPPHSGRSPAFRTETRDPGPPSRTGTCVAAGRPAAAPSPGR